MSGGGWEKSIYHKKYPWQLGQHSSVWISSCCFCMFLMLSLEVSKHKEGKLSVPASVTEWVNDLVPDIFSPVYLSVNWKKSVLTLPEVRTLPMSLSFFLICGVYNPARSCSICRISHALLHKCMHFPFAFCLRRLQAVFLRLRMLLLWLPDRVL